MRSRLCIAGCLAAGLAAIAPAQAQDPAPETPLVLPDLRGAAAGPDAGGAPLDMEAAPDAAEPPPGDWLGPSDGQGGQEISVEPAEAADLDASTAADPPAPPPPGDAAEGAAAAVLPNPFFSVPLESLEATRSAPLFTPSRTAPSAEPEPLPDAAPVEATVEAPPGPPDLKLIGVVKAGAEEMAIFSDPNTAEVQRLRPGEEYQGWTVKIVDARTVELQSGEQRHTLTMFTDYPATGQAPTVSPDPASEDVEGWTGETENGFDEGSRNQPSDR